MHKNDAFRVFLVFIKCYNYGAFNKPRGYNKYHIRKHIA